VTANDILHTQAVCLCSRTYSPMKPGVQVLLGRCRDWVSSEERSAIIKRVTQCTDGDYAGLAMDTGLSLEFDGKVGASFNSCEGQSKDLTSSLVYWCRLSITPTQTTGSLPGPWDLCQNRYTPAT
jgi:hypothetical protein